MKTKGTEILPNGSFYQEEDYAMNGVPKEPWKDQKPLIVRLVGPAKPCGGSGAWELHRRPFFHANLFFT
jgi:hypothetical protein